MRWKGLVKQNSEKSMLILIAAFAAIYVLWGSTYLAIKFAIETLPAFTMTGSRFLLAGVTLFLAGRFSRNYERPTWPQWRSAFVVGVLLFMGGTGGVVLAEHHISSSLTALLVATEPFWIVLLSWWWLKGPVPSLKVILGILVGFFGVYLLIGNGGIGAVSEGANPLRGTLFVLVGAVTWAAGSIYGLRAQANKSPLVMAGMQMLMGGSVLLLAGALRGEWNGFDISAVSTSSWLGLVYLYVFGSLIGFTAYSWLLKNATPSMVATYAYVNPVVAVILGWAFAGESFTGKMLLGAAVIVSSVILITGQKPAKAEKEEARRIEATEECAPSLS